MNERREFPMFKVADLELAEWGRKEIRIAEKEMPGLTSLRSKYGKDKTKAMMKIFSGPYKAKAMKKTMSKSKSIASKGMGNGKST